MKNQFDDLSDIQMEKYLSICGYEYVPETIEGKFMTKAPYNNHEWNLSPWLFQFKFDKRTGNLYCYLGHRMTNDRTYGWDFEGDNLSYEDNEKVFPVMTNIRILSSE